MLSPRWVGREQLFLSVYSVSKESAGEGRTAAARARRRKEEEEVSIVVVFGWRLLLVWSEGNRWRRRCRDGDVDDAETLKREVVA